MRANGETSMSFSVGDAVRVWEADRLHRQHVGRIQRILPNRLSQRDFQEYVVEFQNTPKERFRFCLCREFELQTVEADS